MASKKKISKKKISKKKAAKKKTTKKEEKNKGGRPTKLTDNLQDSICSLLSEGISLRTICLSSSMPCKATVFKWLREIDGFSDQYVKAKQESADALIEDMIEIADNEVSQPLIINGKPIIIDKKVITTVDGPSVNHARLRIDTRKWLASKLKPKKYGDKPENETLPQDQNITINLIDAKK